MKCKTDVYPGYKAKYCSCHLRRKRNLRKCKWYFLRSLRLYYTMKIGRILVLAVLFLFLPHRGAVGLTQPTLILISYDGFRWDYMEKVPTPNLDWIVEHGVKAKHLTNAFVTKTFPNHFTLVTGLYEESHGLVGNTFFDPVFNETFYINSPNYLDPKWWRGEPIWITNQKAWKKSAVIFWPGSEVKIEGQYPTYYRNYDRDLSFEERVDFVMSMLELEDSPNFIAAYFNEPDHTGHQYGPDSPEVANVIRRMDNVTGYLLENLRTRGLIDQVRDCLDAANDFVGIVINYLKSSCLSILQASRELA